MFKGILDKYQLEPRNCVFLDDMEDNTIAAETLDLKAYDVVEILKKLNKQKTFYLFCSREFFVNKILQNAIYILH
ncbi:hypothetical protein UKS_13720 [Streptococcus sp. 116-D4]|nr:hypothetical protein UKS_13720 [Streptococcus sp. 116-D4]